MTHLFRTAGEIASEFLAAAGTCLYLLGLFGALYTALEKLPEPINWPARAMRDGGTDRPSARPVRRLTANLTAVGSWTGSSPGRSPLRMCAT